MWRSARRAAPRLRKSDATMSLPITDALQQAQDAISGGNYRSAVTTCSRLVKQFPSYAAAHRLLGEAYLEQGLSADAERSFTAALAGNPRQPFAYLGLGLLAEDRGATDTALAYCQVAWELSPQLAQLREPVVRVSTRRYGADGQLQLTRAALAQLHANASRLRRAANEYRAALADLPERIDLKLGLAEALWRLGVNDEAAGLAAQVLEQQPDAVQALVIQTDLERRAGSALRAAELLARLRAVDPDGDLAESMLAGHEQADRAFLTVAAEAVPLVSEQIDAVLAERPHIAPAPDFNYVPSRSEAPLADLADLEPISIEEFGAVTGETVAVNAATPETDVFSELGALGFEDFSEEPFDPNEAMPSFAAAVQPVPLADAVMDDDLSALAAALEGDVAQAVARAGVPANTEPQALEPFDFAMFDQPTAGAAVAAPASPNAPFSADASHDFEDFSSDAAGFEQAVPPAEAPRGYTTVLQELDNAGLAPFDAQQRESPSTQAHGAQATAAAADADAALTDTDELTRMNRQWDNIDAEIQNAVPWEMQGGFTDQLRSLEEIGLAPFEFEDEETPQAAPSTLPVAAPADAGVRVDAAVDEVLETRPAAALDAHLALALAQSDAPALAEVEAEPVAPAEASAADDVLLSGLEPFVFEDFEQEEGSRAATAQLFRDAGGKSAVPSDADLEALLAAEDEPFPDGDSGTVVEANAETTATTAPTALAAPESADAWALELDVATATEQPVTQASEPDEFEQFIHSTMAATRMLPAEQPSVTAPERAPAAETDAVLQAEGDVDELVTTDSLYERARVAKDQLVAEGLISGDREFNAAVAEPAAPPDTTATTAGGSPTMAADDSEQGAGADAYAALTTGASRDTATLRAALIADPNDAELRWWLAEALRERGDIADAYIEYRWVIRNAPERHEAVLRALSKCVEHGQQPDMAHRLLADIYRRRGEVARASNHAALALQQRQRDTQR